MPLHRRALFCRCTPGIAPLAGRLGCGGTNDAVDVLLDNGDGTTHRLSVTFDGSVLLDETVALSAGESARTTAENPETTGSAAGWRIRPTADERSRRCASGRARASGTSP